MNIKSDYLEKDYPFLVKEIMIFIDEMKKDCTREDVSLIDIIMEFSFRHNLDVELVGDAISSDIYFKSFIEKDCEMHRIFITPNLQVKW